jgi:hypothetical protein
LDIAPEYAPAYAGKLCAELKVRNEDGLGDYEKPIAEYNSFQKAVRFADEEYKVTLEGYDEKIRERLRSEQYIKLIQEKNRASEYEFPNLAERFRAMDGYKDTAELADECGKQYLAQKKRREEQEERERLEQYQRICEQTKTATTEDDWQKCAEQFWAMNGYKNTSKLAEQCDAKSLATKEQREERERREQYNRLCEEVSDAKTMEDWQRFAEAFRSMGGYKNTAELASQCEERYRKLKESRDEQKKEQAIIDRYCPNGIGVNAMDEDGWLPLDRAASHGDLAAVRLLVSKGASVNARNIHRNTPLIEAAERCNSIEIVKFLVSKGANVNAVGCADSTALFRAAWGGNIEVVKFLVSRGADLDPESVKYWYIKNRDILEFLWTQMGLCRHCGGQMVGMFTKKCKSCGKSG